MSFVFVSESDGQEIARDVYFDEDNIVQEDPFAESMPDKEEFEGHTGNEGSSTTHFYHRTVGRLAVIVDVSRPMKYFTRAVICLDPIASLSSFVRKTRSNGWIDLTEK